MREVRFAEGEFYHIFNRGTEKRAVFLDDKDFKRFLESVEIFNTIQPVGSIYEHSFLKDKLGRRTSKLVNIVCYCLNPNHYHLILEQVAEKGVSAFMKRLGGGYTKYFNNRYKRSGVLFQGGFKAAHVDSNEYLLHVSAYVNLNNKVHKISRSHRSSWLEYLGKAKTNICRRDIILDQFRNLAEYKEFAESSLLDILERKKLQKELALLLLE